MAPVQCAAQRTVMSKWRRSPVESSIQVYGDSRSYHAETKSKPACLHRRGAREKSSILNINTPIFFNSSARTGLTELTYELTYGEKSWGHRQFWDFLKKKPFSYSNTYKNRHAIWSTFWRWTAKKIKPGLPETVWKRFQQKNWHVYVQKSKWRSHLKIS